MQRAAPVAASSGGCDLQSRCHPGSELARLLANGARWASDEDFPSLYWPWRQAATVRLPAFCTQPGDGIMSARLPQDQFRPDSLRDSSSAQHRSITAGAGLSNRSAAALPVRIPPRCARQLAGQIGLAGLRSSADRAMYANGARVSSSRAGQLLGGLVRRDPRRPPARHGELRGAAASRLRGFYLPRWPRLSARASHVPTAG